MGELIVQLAEKFSSPALIAALVALCLAIVSVLRVAGEFFIQLGQFGKQAEKENWLDSTGAFLRKASEGFGKILAWFGIGNKK